MIRLGLLTVLAVALLPVLSEADEEVVEISLEKTAQVDNLREWKYIVLHHTATEVGSVESIHAAHRERRDADGNPWRGIGYHFLIGNGRGMPDGEVAATFRWQEQSDGAHAGQSRYNALGIGICLVGNFEEEPPTPAQLKSLRELMTNLRTHCRIEPDCIVRHTDIKQTACPGKQFPWEALVSSLPDVALQPRTVPVSSTEAGIPAKLIGAGLSD